jgi:sporulation protein YlmC with PRC-barrel domain
MDLIRDVLDKKLIDREDCPMGRASGLVIQFGENTQPHITHIVVGGPTLWARIHPSMGKLSAKLSRLWGPKRAEPVKIPWSRVKTVGKDIKLDVEAKDSGAIDWEIWIARHVIERIPGGGSEEEE